MFLLLQLLLCAEMLCDCFVCQQIQLNIEESVIALVQKLHQDLSEERPQSANYMVIKSQDKEESIFYDKKYSTESYGFIMRLQRDSHFVLTYEICI